MKKANYAKLQTHVGRVIGVTGTGITRINDFIVYLLDLKRCNLTSSEHYAFSLLLLDGVSLDLLEIAVRQRPKICSHGVTISWQCANGQINRFLLSSVSIRLHVDIRDQVSVDAKRLIAVYQSFHPRRLLRNDVNEWRAFHCPGPMYDSLTGVLNMSSIPDHAYLRLDRQLALKNEGVDDDENVLQQSFAHVFESEKSDGSDVFVEGIVSACSRKAGKSDAHAKRLMLQKCEQHAKLLDDYGIASALILAWAINLIINGTRSEDNLSQTTIGNYVGTISKPLFAEIKTFKANDVSEQNYLEIYKRVIEAVSKGRQGIAGSALSSFHAFLEDWFGVQPIYRNQFLKEVDVAPKSNVIWPHEIERIVNWLDTCYAESRLIDSWRLTILLASHQRFRVSEIFYLRIKDIEFYEEHAEIHIAKGKTHAAKRILNIEEKSVLNALRSFIDRRFHENALPSDYLFGDPSKPKKVYKLGQFYWGLNQLLKQVTGDQKISFHALSDTVISQALIGPLSGENSGYKNAYNQLSTDFGHHSIITSCSSYMHLHHLSLRLCMDRALKTVALSSSTAELWSGKSAGTMRKQISLKQLDSSQYYWESMLGNQTIQHDFECCGFEYFTQEPPPPRFLQKASHPNFEKVLLIIKDLSDGMLIASIASRHSVEAAFVSHILDSTMQVLAEMNLVSIRKLKTLIDSQVVAKGLEKLGFDFNRIEQPKLQCMVQFFKRQKFPLDHYVLQGVSGWLELCEYQTYQAIHIDQEAFLLIQLLKAVGLQISRIAVFIAEGVNQEKYALMVKKLFVMSYSISPTIFFVKARGGRPPVYFSICDKKVTSTCEPHGAANCMSGFKAMMLCLAVMIRMESNHE